MRQYSDFAIFHKKRATVQWFCTLRCKNVRQYNGFEPCDGFAGLSCSLLPGPSTGRALRQILTSCGLPGLPVRDSLGLKVGESHQFHKKKKTFFQGGVVFLEEKAPAGVGKGLARF